MHKVIRFAIKFDEEKLRTATDAKADETTDEIIKAHFMESCEELDVEVPNWEISTYEE